MLRIGPKNVGELARNFQMSRPAVSKHLRLLRSTGLITTQKRGATHICRLNAKPLRAVSLWVRDYEMFWGENLRGLKKYIEGAANQKRGDR